MAGDPHTRRLLWFVFAGSRGGPNRLRMVSALRGGPLNANQLSGLLGLDYKAVRHHLGVLERNSMVERAGERYGVAYSVSGFLEANLGALDEISEKLDKSK